MNISLTWANYALIVSVCLVIYYFVVLLFYRRSFTRVPHSKAIDSSNSLSNLFTGESALNNSENSNLFEEEIKEKDLQPSNEDQDLRPDTQAFSDEIQAYTYSCGDEVNKEDLIQHLKKIIQKYPSLINSNSQYELSQLIAIATENNCSIHLSADELSELWNG